MLIEKNKSLFWNITFGVLYLKKIFKIAIVIVLLLFSVVILSEAIDSVGTIFSRARARAEGEKEDIFKECEPVDNVFNQSQLTNCVNNCTKMSAEGGLPPDIDLFQILGSTGTSYLRTGVGEHYDGVWSLANPISEPYNGEPIQQTVSDYGDKSMFRFYISPLVEMGGFIPSVLNPNELNIEWTIKLYRDQQIFFSSKKFNSSYAISYTKYDFDIDILSKAEPIFDHRYLNVPDELLEKTRPLALNVTSGLVYSYDKLKSLEEYLQTNYVYDVNYTRAPQDIDPVEWFLFHERRGVCANFNSAFVLLARSIGLPARLVGGYIINPTSDVQTVNARQGHVYSEVPFRDIGWITFDATGVFSVSPQEIEEPEGGEEDVCKECEPIDEVFNQSRCTDCVNNCTKMSAEGGLPPDIDLFQILGSTGTSYLRTMVGEHYDREWSQVDPVPEPYNGRLIQQTVSNYTDKSMFRFYISPLVEMGGFIPSVLNPNELNIEWTIKLYRDQQIFFSPKKFNSSYTISYTNYNFDIDTLRRTKHVSDSRYLNIPEKLLEKIFPLAFDVTFGLESSYDKLKSLEAFLQTNYVYDLNYNRSPLDMDPVEWFLFYERRGVCSNFNSAFVLLARSLGLPARLVGGYSINPTLEVQTVNSNQSHCYSEVLFEDFGWIKFDATAGERALEQVKPKLKIPTYTEITYQDSIYIKGSTFTLIGEVRDIHDNQVDNLNTLIYFKKDKNEAGLLCGKADVLMGRFNVTCNLPLNISVGDYLIQAHTLGNNRYNESWSDPPLRVVSETQIDFTLPKKVISGRPFIFHGNVTELVTDIPLLNSTCILDTGDKVIKLNTDSNGLLSGSYTYFKPGNYSFILRWPGSTYFLNTSFSSDVIAIPLTISPKIPDILVRLEDVTLHGLVHAEELIGDNEELTLSVNDMEIGTVITDEDGNFTYYFTVPQKQELGEIQIGFHLKSNGVNTSMHATVVARTNLHLKAPESIIWTKPFNITTRLINDIGKPIQNANLTLEYNFKGSRQSSTALTDFHGAAIFPIKLSGKPSTYTIYYNISYLGDKYYLGSVAHSSFEVIILEKKLQIIPALIVTAICLSGFIGFLWFKRRERKNGDIQEDQGESDELDKIPEEQKMGKSVGKARINIRIEFPQIVPPFPLVWGVDDNLLLKFYISDRDGKPIKDANILLKVDKEESNFVADKNGVAEVWKTFPQKGLIHIKVSYLWNEDLGKIEKLVDIKIVDYREEIVDLFNEKFEKICVQKKNIEGYFTAREFQAILQKEKESTLESLEKMVTIFEFADYSTHGIKRQEYERFYLAKQEFELVTNGQGDN